MTTSSASSMTPRSPLMTPKTSQIDLLLAGKGAYSEHDDLPQMNELADIARCAGNMPLDDDRSLSYLLTCLDDLRIVIDRRKFDALNVEAFGARIEKLIRFLLWSIYILCVWFTVRQPDPSTPNLKIDLLAEISRSPCILSEVDASLKTKRMKNDVDEYLKGAANIKVAGTDMNNKSSRSHSVFTCWFSKVKYYYQPIKMSFTNGVIKITNTNFFQTTEDLEFN
ncbi:unnamed protein product [Lactuca saligna]|uniref:CCR4-Not complex component Not1 C-terminal domain-containing protein n=1 Tax=Lactuca saligna TaxID=75948 RepID=A0AA36EEW5_LACSI|nr:unnamed protein product [Lactuca saligna]